MQRRRHGDMVVEKLLERADIVLYIMPITPDATA
jgi:hypothetical protein